jgi:hypothetical protein
LNCWTTIWLDADDAEHTPPTTTDFVFVVSTDAAVCGVANGKIVVAVADVFQKT